MNDFKVLFQVFNPDEPPCVDVHYEMVGQYALWLTGRYGDVVSDGHEIGLSADLIHDLDAWCEAKDALYNPNDPLSSGSPEGFLENGFELAKRVRAELPAEWVVTTWHPVENKQVVLPLHESPPGLTSNLS